MPEAVADRQAKFVELWQRTKELEDRLLTMSRKSRELRRRLVGAPPGQDEVDERSVAPTDVPVAERLLKVVEKSHELLGALEGDLANIDQELGNLGMGEPEAGRISL